MTQHLNEGAGVMFLKNISFYNFRNLHNSRPGKQSIEFNKNINLIIGENAQGKTNLLESIYILINGKSFREKNDLNLINHFHKEAVVRAVICTDDDARAISVAVKITPNGSKFYVDSKVKRAKGLSVYEDVSAVVFLPDDLGLIKGGPANRRDYLDNIISNIWQKHRVNRINYFKALKQRNFLLKNNKLASLDIWDRQLIKYGSRLIRKRLETIKALSPMINEILERFTGNEEARLKYNTSFLKENDSEELQAPDIEEIFTAALNGSKNDDIKLQMTTIGPHKDDIIILLNDRNSREFCSQGQQRTLAIALRIAEWEIYKREASSDSILLLDDIFSELDENRKKNLLDFICQKKQSFITSVSAEAARDIKVPDISIYKMGKGVVSAG